MSDASTESSPEPLARLRDYELLSRLGQGGMGSVYLARHAHLDKQVAIKLLPLEYLRNPEMVARFKREMKAVGKLHHPNVIQALDGGEHKGIQYLVLEFAEGMDLNTLLARYGKVPISDACEIIRQTAIGLEHAHLHGLVHRDIKPANLLLAWPQHSSVRKSPSSPDDIADPESSVEGESPRGGDDATGEPRETVDWAGGSASSGTPLKPVVKILDLGLALLNTDQHSVAEGLTGTGQIMGTLDYMAPEQTSNTHAVDIRADIYSLGCTLYALLAGRPPFHGDQYSNAYQKIVAHNQESPRPLHEVRQNVPPELAAILSKMLAKNPDDRYTSPIEVAAALEPFCANNTLLSTLVEAEARRAEHTSRSDARTQDLNSSAMQGTATGAHDRGGLAVSVDDELLNLLRSAVVDETIVSKPAGNTAATELKLNIAATPTVKQARQHRQRERSRLRIQLLAAAGCFVCFIVIAAVIFRVTTNYGTIELTLYHDDAEVTVDGDTIRLPPGNEDDQYPIRVAPGRRQLQVTKAGHVSYSREIEVTKGQTQPVLVELPPVGAPRVVSPPPRGQGAPSGPPAVRDAASRAPVAEPPPLEEWLDGREILTVKQDGTAMFTKIQDALDALKTGQVVEVLDKGPYLETLYKVLPQDTGLITRVASHVVLPEWSELPTTSPYKYRGHTLSGQFRLCGFALSTPQQHEAVLLTLNGGDFTIENCVFPNISTYQSAQRSLECSSGGRAIRNVIRDCAFGGNVYLGFQGEHASALVLRNHFRANIPAFGAGCFEGRAAPHTLLIRENVFDESTFRALNFGVFAGTFNLRAVVEQNTILSRNELIFVGNGIPEVPLIVRHNLIASTQGIVLTNGAEDLRDLAEERIIRSGNCYFQAPTRPDCLALSADDVLAQPPLLSRDPAAADYGRLKQDEANPIWSGAFAPGPAPLQGDWFTRLQERWREAVKSVGRLSEPSQPVNEHDSESRATVAEPPPLEEWLEGREILTVKQDGSAMFTKIQDALDALKQGQVVEVLDKGPYEESLAVVEPANDIGLISRTGTVIGSQDRVFGAGQSLVHIKGADQLRIDGVNFVGVTNHPGGALVRMDNSQSIVMRHCIVHDVLHSAADKKGPGVMFFVRGIRNFGADRPPHVLVNCWLDCVASIVDDSVVISENVFRRTGVSSGNTHQLAFSGHNAKVRMIGNIVDCAQSAGINFRQLGEEADIRLVNNTIYGSYGYVQNVAQEYVPVGRVEFFGNILNRVGLQLNEPINLSWDLRGNCVSLDSTTTSDAILQFPASTNLAVDPQIASFDPNSRDYMRPSTDSPLADGGLGGDYPTYIGAVPAGPVPAEGDWLLRLQQRWQAAQEDPK